MVRIMHTQTHRSGGIGYGYIAIRVPPRGERYYTESAWREGRGGRSERERGSFGNGKKLSAEPASGVGGGLSPADYIPSIAIMR